VNPVDTDPPDTAICFYLQIPIAAQREIVLRDLIGFGEIRIKVVFSIKLSIVSDLTIQR
jgi:hypothetical protein